MSSRVGSDPVEEEGCGPSHVEQLLRRAAHTDDVVERERLWDEVVLLTMPVARSVALRYRQRGESIEDLTQVAYLGLVKAVRGFDPDHGSSFLSYAVPSITGEVRRWFRDKGWDIRPPRRLQELRGAMAAVLPELTQKLGRAPRAQEVAERLDVCVEDVIETLAAVSCYSTDSLEAPVAAEGSMSLGETLGESDTGLEEVEDRVALRPLLAAMPPRDRHILSLRFYRGWTQAQIAEDVGVTQMQVSRLLTRALAQLRASLTETP